MQAQPLCKKCQSVVCGSRLEKPHEWMIRIGTGRKGSITIYYCQACGQYWEYRADHILPGWQTSFIEYDYLLKKNDGKESDDS
jgi:hypothetical protein